MLELGLSLIELDRDRLRHHRRCLEKTLDDPEAQEYHKRRINYAVEGIIETCNKYGIVQQEHHFA